MSDHAPSWASPPLAPPAEPGNEPTSPRSTFTARYAASMPAEYRASFDDEAIAAHAGIAWRRGSAATRVEIWRELPDGVVAICVVADDRPGLLARMTTALVAHGLDVVIADAYCRERGQGVVEAVDFLWIRRSPRSDGLLTPIRPGDVIVIGELLDALVRGEADAACARGFARFVRAAATSTVVRFAQSAREGVVALSVETPDRSGLLLAITTTLYAAGLQIVALHARTENGRAIDRFEVADAGGQALTRERQLALQSAIFAALELVGDPRPSHEP